MHKSATKCNKTIGKWCKNKHGASKIIDTFETYHCHEVAGREEIFHVQHNGLIKDGLHLLVVGNGHVQEILVLQEFV
jgi:hypothetical protein